MCLRSRSESLPPAFRSSRSRISSTSARRDAIVGTTSSDACQARNRSASSATSSGELVLDRAAVATALRARKGRPLLLVDLAVPRDLDPAINELDGCFLYDVDDLEAVVETSLAGRRVEAVRAEQLVAAEAERFREWQASLTVVPAIASLRARAEEIRSSELAKAEGRLGRLPESERKLVESVTSQIVAKLLHLPTVRMKEAAAAADGVVYADVVRHLFGLGEEEQS